MVVEAEVDGGDVGWGEGSGCMGSVGVWRGGGVEMWAGVRMWWTGTGRPMRCWEGTVESLDVGLRDRLLLTTVGFRERAV